MRNIAVLSFISLDGVMQAPGGKEEDTSSDFKFGGWTVPFYDDAAREEMGKQMTPPFDILLGRKTYDLFASYWPNQENDYFADCTKYVVSNNDVNTSWKDTIQIKGDIVEEIRKIKQEDGPVIQVHGSGNLIQTLLKEDLVDELWLKTYPVLLGKGKKLFEDGVVPAGYKLLKSFATPGGVIFANYQRDGKVKTGSFS